MPVIAALFDSDASATQAMDKLLNEHLKDVETRVIKPGQNTNSTIESGLPIIPDTSGGFAGGTAAPNPRAGEAITSDAWLNNMDRVERNFYRDGLREGSTLVLAKVGDKDDEKVRQLLSSYGARTYERK